MKKPLHVGNSDDREKLVQTSQAPLQLPLWSYQQRPNNLHLKLLYYTGICAVFTEGSRMSSNAFINTFSSLLLWGEN